MRTHLHGSHLVDHIQKPHLRSDSILHVVGVVSNPVRFHSRYRLARAWIAHMAQTPHVHLTIVEAAFGDRHHELQNICEQYGVDFIPLRTRSEVWIKESMINLGIRHAIVKHNAKYLSWVDADVFFRNPGWALETVHQLQHYPVVQPWQTAINLGADGNVSKVFDSVGFKVKKDGVRIPAADKGKYSGNPYVMGHSGYAWACTRTFWENVQGLIDFAILGSADHHMALGCRGYYSHSLHSAIKGPFMSMCHAWQERAMQLTHGVVWYVPGRIEHEFHGPMRRRDYVGRWNILIRHEFDPATDIRHDEQGLIQLVGKPHLEHDVRQYNRSRLEDSIEEY